MAMQQRSHSYSEHVPVLNKCIQCQKQSKAHAKTLKFLTLNVPCILSCAVFARFKQTPSKKWFIITQILLCEMFTLGRVKITAWCLQKYGQ